MGIVMLTFALLNQARMRRALAATGAAFSIVGVVAFITQAAVS
jgi:hypothetical protein